MVFVQASVYLWEDGEVSDGGKKLVIGSGTMVVFFPILAVWTYSLYDNTLNTYDVCNFLMYCNLI